MIIPKKKPTVCFCGGQTSTALDLFYYIGRQTWESKKGKLKKWWIWHTFPPQFMCQDLMLWVWSLNSIIRSLWFVFQPDITLHFRNRTLQWHVHIIIKKFCYENRKKDPYISLKQKSYLEFHKSKQKIYIDPVYCTCRLFTSWSR